MLVRNAVLILCSCYCWAFVSGRFDVPGCDDGMIPKEITIDFSMDGRGNSYSVGDSPTSLPLNISVRGFRRTGSGGRHSRNDLAIGHNGELIVNRNDNKTDPVAFRSGGSIKFTFRNIKSIYRINQVITKRLSPYAAITLVGRSAGVDKVLVLDRRAGGPETLQLTDEWINIRSLRVKLYEASALMAFNITVCQEPCIPAVTTITPPKTTTRVTNNNDSTVTAQRFSYPRVENFGHSVAISGNTMVVSSTGGIESDSLVYVYVYVRANDGLWSLQQRIRVDESDNLMRIYTGRKMVAISEDESTATATIVVGVPRPRIKPLDNNATGHRPSWHSKQGRVHVFIRPQRSVSWTKQADLAPTRNILSNDDNDVYDDFGRSVSISGNTIVVGAPGRGKFGSAFVFEKDRNNSSVWSEAAVLAPADTLVEEFLGIANGFGSIVSIHNDRLVVGLASVAFSPFPAFVYTRFDSSVNWTLQDRLSVGNDTSVPGHIFSCAIEENIIVISGLSFIDDVEFVDVFEKEPGSSAWIRLDRLVSNMGAHSLAISGGTIVAGFSSDDLRGPFSGSVKVFVRGEGSASWKLNRVLKLGENFDEFGTSVSISRSVVAVGALGKLDESSRRTNGAAYTNVLR